MCDLKEEEKINKGWGWREDRSRRSIFWNPMGRAVCVLGNQNPGTVPSISEREFNPKLEEGNQRPQGFKRLI